MPTSIHEVEHATESEMDEALRRWREGDVDAFEVVVRTYMKQAYYTALGIVGNHEDAVDLSQEAFVRAFRARDRFDLRQKFYTWYYRILRNLCLNHLRNRGRACSIEVAGSDLEGASEPTGLADPAALAERNELTERVWAALNQLAPDEREILLLREIENCRYAEIAERLEIPKGTVMSRLFYARKRLKELLERSHD